MSVIGIETKTGILRNFIKTGLLFFAMLSLVTAKAHPAIDLVTQFFEKPAKPSEFKIYMQSPLRQKLASEHNVVEGEHAANDGSNWSGCQVGKGVLAGTYRDISACAATACYGREVTVEEMKNLTYKEAENIINWIWNQISASKINDQSVANLTMHIQMQYGNIRIVQAALNKMGAKLRLSGRMDKNTLKVLNEFCRTDAADTYNQIRAQLLASYSRLRGTHLYVRVISREFPAKISLRRLYMDLCEKSIQSASFLYAAVFPKAEKAWLAVAITK